MSRVCPHCGGVLTDRLRAVDGGPVDPTPDDLAVCDHCGVALVFTAELQFRLLDFIEWVKLRPAERLQLSRAHFLFCIRRVYGDAAEAAIARELQ